MARDLLAGGQPRDLLAGIEAVQPEQPRPEYIGGEAAAVLGELAAAANRSVTEFVDFIGPGAVNSILQLAGSDKRVPTVTDFLDDKMSVRGGFMEPGLARDAVQALGTATSLAAGGVPVTRNLTKAPGIAAEFLGIGSARSPALTTQAAETALQIADGNADTAGKMVSAGRVVDDKIGKEGIKQGLGDDFVALVKSAPVAARKKMVEMLDIAEKGKKNLRYKAGNRPLDVAGKSVRDRVDVVWQANRVAARSLDGVAESLKGKGVDPSPAVDDFLQDLQGLGVKFDGKTGALSFEGSDIEKLKGPIRIITDLVDRMRNTRSPDAYDVHRLKKYIDELATYGKSKKGVSGRVEGIMKSLRHNLDEILDSNFPEYNRINTQYAETRGAIDALQDVAGKKMDLLGGNSSSAIGTLTRRILSNAQSRSNLLDALSQLDTTARKYGKPGKGLVTYSPSKASRIGLPKDIDFDDDITGQVIFADKLDEVFGTHARTSLQGDVSKVVDRAAVDAATGQTLTGLVREGAEMGIKKARGINEENALKAMRELLERGL